MSRPAYSSADTFILCSFCSSCSCSSICASTLLTILKGRPFRKHVLILMLTQLWSRHRQETARRICCQPASTPTASWWSDRWRRDARRIARDSGRSGALGCRRRSSAPTRETQRACWEGRPAPDRRCSHASQRWSLRSYGCAQRGRQLGHRLVGWDCRARGFLEGVGV